MENQPTKILETNLSSVKYVLSMKGFCAGGGFRTVKITNQYHFIGWQVGIDNFLLQFMGYCMIAAISASIAFMASI